MSRVVLPAPRNPVRIVTGRPVAPGSRWAGRGVVAGLSAVVGVAVLLMEGGGGQGGASAPQSDAWDWCKARLGNLWRAGAELDPPETFTIPSSGVSHGTRSRNRLGRARRWGAPWRRLRCRRARRRCGRVFPVARCSDSPGRRTGACRFFPVSRSWSWSLLHRSSEPILVPSRLKAFRWLTTCCFRGRRGPAAVGAAVPTGTPTARERTGPRLERLDRMSSPALRLAADRRPGRPRGRRILPPRACAGVILRRDIPNAAEVRSHCAPVVSLASVRAAVRSSSSLPRSTAQPAR